jgi:putative transposase
LLQGAGDKLSATHDLKPILKVAKRSRKYGWLANFDAMSLQQSCINLDRAFKNFFEHRARFPRFKSKRGSQSSYHCTGKIAVGDDWITIPKCPGRIMAVAHRALAGELKSITLARTLTGKYFAACLFDYGETFPELPTVVPAEAIVGIDVGLSHLAIESTGRNTGNPRFVTRAQRNLRRKQKCLSRKKKGSKNRAKARLLAASAHERVANARGDFQHKLARPLVDENQAIVVENLKIKNMQKNRRLARHIRRELGQSWRQGQIQSRAGGQALYRNQPVGADRACLPPLRISLSGENAPEGARVDLRQLRCSARPGYQRGQDGQALRYP